MARTLGMDQQIVWTGMLRGDEKWGAIRSAEFFFLPSHQENFGVVVAEALACGVPALISDKVNIWREVAEANAGLVAPDTLEGATTLLESWLALDAAGQRQLRDQALPCFESTFEIQRATENLLGTLKAIVPAAVLNRDFVNA
jgi:glycosyltransferase involved in cell wall biosynthesis